MPSFTAGEQLIRIHEIAPLWDWKQWQDITGVHHGLFPVDDALLPDGLTRDAASHIESFMTTYRELPDSKNGEKRHAFYTGRKEAPHTGRILWKTWINKGWKDWKINALISEALTAQGLHPAMLYTQCPDAGWPHADSWIPTAVDFVAQTLFGSEAFIPGTNRLGTKLRPRVCQLVQVTWACIRKQVVSSERKGAELKEAALEAVKNVRDSKATMTGLRSVITAVKKWSDVANLLNHQEDQVVIEDILAQLQASLITLGAKRHGHKPRPTAKGLLTASSIHQLDVATQGDVQNLMSLYLDHFDQPTDIEAPIQPGTISVCFGDRVEGADPGMEVEIRMPPDALYLNLGFTDGLPFLCNTLRHRAGLSPWDYPDLFTEEHPTFNDDIEEFKLHWHQVAGVHSLVRMNFKATPTPGCVGALIADEVGLGKTFQTAAFIAFMAELIDRVTLGQALPPYIAKHPYLGETHIKELAKSPQPHVVVVPGTLIAQWQAELKKILRPKSFDLLTYGNTRHHRAELFGPTGPLAQSHQKPHHIIILASHAALTQDFSTLYGNDNPGTKDLPWAMPDRLAKPLASDESTLFGQKWCITAIDEAQAFRNCGLRHYAALALCNASIVRLANTATPLQTSTKDVAAMGRLIGLPFFLSKRAYDMEKEDMAALRTAKKEVSEDCDPFGDNEHDPIRVAQVKIAIRMQGQFENHILRRTAESLDWRGEKIIQLPPYNPVHLVLRLTERELEVIRARDEEIKDRVSTANGLAKLTTRNFYLEYRMAVGYARIRPSDDIPHFKTLSEWEDLKSTKFDSCARLCQYILAQDGLPDVGTDDGNLVFPAHPDPHPSDTVSRTNKIVIYQEFPSLGPLLRNVLSLYGMKALYLDGNQSYNKRAKTVKRFHSEDGARILIMSSVGSTGLNLTVANFAILLDQTWSEQDQRQFIGRIHRQGQRRDVVVYHLLADETADMLLCAMARGKGDMLDAFLDKAAGQDLYDLLSGKPVQKEGDEVTDDEDKPQPKKPRRRRKGKQLSATSEAAAPPLSNHTVPEPRGCAVGPDGKLLEAAQIQFSHDVSDDERAAEQVLAQRLRSTSPISFDPQESSSDAAIWRQGADNDDSRSMGDQSMSSSMSMSMQVGMYRSDDDSDDVDGSQVLPAPPPITDLQAVGRKSDGERGQLKRPHVESPSNSPPRPTLSTKDTAPPVLSLKPKAKRQKAAGPVSGLRTSMSAPLPRLEKKATVPINEPASRPSLVQGMLPQKVKAKPRQGLPKKAAITDKTALGAVSPSSIVKQAEIPMSVPTHAGDQPEDVEEVMPLILDIPSFLAQGTPTSARAEMQHDPFADGKEKTSGPKKGPQPTPARGNLFTRMNSGLAIPTASTDNVASSSTGPGPGLITAGSNHLRRPGLKESTFAKEPTALSRVPAFQPPPITLPKSDNPYPAAKRKSKGGKK